MTDDLGMPETVADAVLARVARLDPPAREALEAVAGLGLRAELWVLDQVLPDADHRPPRRGGRRAVAAER